MECSIELLVDWLIVWKMEFTYNERRNQPPHTQMNKLRTHSEHIMHALNKYSNNKKPADRSLSMSPYVELFSCLSAAFVRFLQVIVVFMF